MQVLRSIDEINALDPFRVVNRYHVSANEARDIAVAAKRSPAILVGWQVNTFAIV